MGGRPGPGPPRRGRFHVQQPQQLGLHPPIAAERDVVLGASRQRRGLEFLVVLGIVAFLYECLAHRNRPSSRTCRHYTAARRHSAAHPAADLSSWREAIISIAPRGARMSDSKWTADKWTTDPSVWAAAAEESLRGAPLESLSWHTPDSLVVKPLYTAQDVAGLPATDTLPGLEPFVRGPQATKYAVKAGTLRPYAGFSQARA